MSYLKTLKSTLLLTMALCLWSPLHAATFTITTLDDSNHGSCGADCSLRDAINAANDAMGADKIVFAAGVTGTIQLVDLLPALNSNINLQGPGASKLTVRGTGVTSTGRVFSITPDSIVNLSSLTVSNGNAEFPNGPSYHDPSEGGGGAIYNERGTITVTDIVVNNSTAGIGGGICNNTGTMTVKGCVISGCTGGTGGGIANVNGPMTILNSTLTNNTASVGGGIYDTTRAVVPGQPTMPNALTVTGCRITNNSATYPDQNNGSQDGGGGIYIYNDAVVTINQTTISNNSAIMSGGGIYAYLATLTLSNSTLNGNSSSRGLSGCIFTDGYTLTATNSTFSGNTAPITSVLFNRGNTIITNCTLKSDPTDNGVHTRNTIFNATGTVQLRNTILRAGIGGTSGGTLSGFEVEGITSQGYNLSDDSGGGRLTATGDQINVDPQLKPLANNGGPTLTHALAVGSPARDKGKDLSGTGKDQRGVARPIDSPSIAPAPGGDNSDIGAFESPDLGPLEIPALAVNSISVTETNGGSLQAQFTVTLSAPSSQTVTVSVKSGPGGSPEATAGTDYIALPATTLTFAPGQTSKTVNVTVLGDTLDENDEKFAVTLSGATNANIITGTGLCTIVDNDAAPSISVSAPNVTEGNDGTATMTFTLKLSADSARNISVQYKTANAATFPATAGTDYTTVPLTTVIFAAGETTKTVNVTVNGDLLDEENERIALSLTNPVNATLGTISDGIIVDDDATPSLSINDVSVEEGNTDTKLMTFTVTLSAPSGRTVSVYAQTGNGGSPAATAGTDYVALAPTQVVFAPGQTARQVSVVINGDTAVELNEKLAVILSGYVNASISDNAGIGTILNDDATSPAPAIAPSDSSGDVTK